MQVLNQLPIVEHPDLLVGAKTGDDAAVYRINDHTALIFTVDFFPPIADDPYQYGAIAAANSLSDVYAMGGKPLLALNVVGFPADIANELLPGVLKGGYAKAAEAGCLVVGGHTVDDAEPKYGMAVIGIVEPGKEVSNAGAQPGDALVLTKPLGTGIVTTAGKQGRVSEQVPADSFGHHGNPKQDRRRSHDQSGRQLLHRCNRVRAHGAPPVHGPCQRGWGNGGVLQDAPVARGLGTAGRGNRPRRHSPQPEQRGRFGQLAS